jgi:hypothetical protein
MFMPQPLFHIMPTGDFIIYDAFASTVDERGTIIQKKVLTGHNPY